MAISGLPGYSYFEHVALSVPDLDEAAKFFVDLFGAEELYRSSRRSDPELMRESFDVNEESEFTLAMLRVQPNLNLELFQWSASGRDKRMPRASDAGGYHLCVSVADIEPAVAFLRTISGVRLLGGIKTVGGRSPVAGSKWTYFVTSWGLRMELVERRGVVNPPAFRKRTRP